MCNWGTCPDTKYLQVSNGKRIKSTWAEEYEKYAEGKLNEGFDYVILGHIHYPMIRKIGEKIYVNCGDWINEFSYGYYDGNTLSLRWWKK